MKSRFLQLIVITICFPLFAEAQYNRYLIELKDKANNTYSLSNPSAYLTQKAIARRLQYNIAIDSTDLPITPRYLDSIRLAGAVTILNVSKWLNQVAIYTTDAAAITKINSFPFVKNAIPIAARLTDTAETSNKFIAENLLEDIPNDNNSPATELANIYNYGQSYGQVHIHQGEFLHNHGFSGQGMQMAILDAGFRNHDIIPTFDSARTNGQFLGNWDFINNSPLLPNSDTTHTHGTHCLSTIAANLPGSFVGTAPKTSFYLFRTEYAATEYPIEENYLAAGLERADSLGTDVSSISLGYSTFQQSIFNHTYSHMNGDITMAARAADFAAKKGMLVVAAMGNDGGNITIPGQWYQLSTPSDADSVLAVGAVNTAGAVASFSSYGPSSDGQVKPDVAGVGWNAVVANAATGQPAFSNGTSFATPNIAGLATCLWQAFPESNNMGIISAIREAASIYHTPDNRIGYGIPDMKKAFVILLKRFYTQDIKQAGCKTLIQWTAKSSGNMNFIVERKLPTDADYTALQTINGTGSFANDTFYFADDLSALTTPVNISYRIKMNIDTDTSFYFTPVSINHQNPCNTYTFTGNGNWNIASNWAGNLIPPAILPAGSSIIIDPLLTGECILNTTQQIQAGGYFEIKSGKKLTMQGNLIIQ